jgi:hypothetical protein
MAVGMKNNRLLALKFNSKTSSFNKEIVLKLNRSCARKDAEESVLSLNSAIQLRVENEMEPTTIFNRPFHLVGHPINFIPKRRKTPSEGAAKSNQLNKESRIKQISKVIKIAVGWKL